MTDEQRITALREEIGRTGGQTAVANRQEVVDGGRLSLTFLSDSQG